MEQIFSFHVTPPDPDRLCSQVTRALEQRTEVLSREKCPRLWALADRFNHQEKAPLPVRRRRRRQRTVLSLICWLLSLVLLVPGLMDPRQLLIPLLVGGITLTMGTIVLWACRPALLGTLSLLSGILLCLGAWGDPSVMGSVLWLGIVQAAVGAAALMTCRKKKPSPYEREAARLLRDRAAATNLQAVCISFSDAGMSITAESMDTAHQIPFEDMFLILETEDLLVVIISDTATILQKADLFTGTLPQLRELLRQRTQYVYVMEEPEEIPA